LIAEILLPTSTEFALFSLLSLTSAYTLHTVNQNGATRCSCQTAP
jgi:hypothetical protein